jgi:hypothetical protein
MKTFYTIPNERRSEIIKTAISVVAKQFDVHVNCIMIKTKEREKYLIPRQIVHALLRRHTSLTLDLIGRETGGFDHASVIGSVKRVDKLSEDAAYLQMFQRCRVLFLDKISKMLGAEDTDVVNVKYHIASLRSAVGGNEILQRSINEIEFFISKRIANFNI